MKINVPVNASVSAFLLVSLRGSRTNKAKCPELELVRVLFRKLGSVWR
jgi:hypothetical protein